MWDFQEESLQNSCLVTIVKNFERYFWLYLNSDDDKIQKHLQGLQKVYSHEMAAKLERDSRMEEKHADFVINKYLNRLNADWFGNFSWEAVVSKLTEMGPEIKKIKIDKKSSNRPWYQIFRYLPNLEVLLYHNNCKDEDLKSVSEFCPNIEKMEIFEEHVTDKGWKYLWKIKNGKVPCSKLRSIVVEWECSRMTDAASAGLVQNLPCLEVLTCYNLSEILYVMHRNDLPTIDQVATYKINRLDLTAYLSSRYDDLLKVCFTLCPNLKILGFPVLKPQQLNWIQDLSTLETVLIDNRFKGDLLDVNEFLKLRGGKLTVLQLCNCFVSLTILSENCPSLNELLLDNVSVEWEETSIPPLKYLETLEMSVSEVNVKSICFILIPLPTLRYMRFLKSDLTLPEIKTAILKCCESSRVRDITFGSSVVEKQFVLDIISTCRSLLYFFVDMYCGMNKNDREEIEKFAKTRPNKPRLSFSDEAVSLYNRFSY